jgi:hypothetical protein
MYHYVVSPYGCEHNTFQINKRMSLYYHLFIIPYLLYVLIQLDHPQAALISRSQWLRLLKHWGSGFESHSRHGCLCVFILCLCYLVCG